MSDLDVLLVTPPSRLEVYQNLSNDYAAIEPPVWSMLIAKYLISRNFKVEILDAEAEHLTHEETAEIMKRSQVFGIETKIMTLNQMLKVKCLIIWIKICQVKIGIF